MTNRRIILIFVLVRLLSVAIVQTWYVPDEYWQSLEVAHKYAFGYGYLTWEWVLGIRSYLYPLIIAFIYKILQVLHLDYAEVLINLPRVLQALLCSYADLCFYRWCKEKKWALFSIVTSWFWFYTCSRTIINSLETALTTIAVSHFPWPGERGGSNWFVAIVAIVCTMRPTAAIHWLPLCMYHIITAKESILLLLIKYYLPVGALVLTISIFIDSCAHGAFIVTGYEFLKLNVLQGVGEWYGSQPWTWYLSSGFPAVLGIHFVPFVIATVKILKDRQLYQNELALLGCITFTIFVYSFLPHKEFRFILPLLPMALNISSSYLSRWSRKANLTIVWICTGMLVFGNIVPAVYLSMIHQRGALSIMGPLRTIAQENPHNTSFLFLMPCHSTPYYSHLHVNVTARFLTCEPNLQRIEGYVDEADVFYENPSRWLRKYYPPSGPLPSHVILFDSLIPSVMDMLSRYKPLLQVFHTNAPTSRVGRYIAVHKRIDF